MNTPNDSRTADLDSMDTAEFADHLLSELEQKPAQLTMVEMGALENWWSKSVRTRRIALVMLTGPWSFIGDKVAEDREFAETVAAAYRCNKDLIKSAKGLAGFLECADLWMTVALCSREDMPEVLAAGEKATENPASHLTRISNQPDPGHAPGFLFQGWTLNT